MAELKQCEFFVLRYVPDAVKDEFVNIGVVVMGGSPSAAPEDAGGGRESQKPHYSPEAGERAGHPDVSDGDASEMRGKTPALAKPAGTGHPGSGSFVEVRLTKDWRRVRCLDATADIEMLEAIGEELQQRLREGGEDRERILHLLRDSFSNTVQATLPRAVLTESPELEIGKLAEIYLESRRRAGQRDNAGRGAILGRMRDEFERAGVWRLMRKKIAAADYTHRGDPLKIDCGYRPNGVIRLFHATPLASDVDAAKVLAFSYPKISAGMRQVEQAKTELTAIIEDDLDRDDEQVAFAIEMMAESNIVVAQANELSRLAARARVEMRV